MSAQTRLATVLNRITARTRVLSIREEDFNRAMKHGDSSAREQRLIAVIARLEVAADELEKV